MVEDRNYLCPQKCDKGVICKEMTGMFVELQDSYFFYPKTHPANNQENIPYQPVLWCIFNKVIDKNSSNFYTEIGKLIPHHNLI